MAENISTVIKRLRYFLVMLVITGCSSTASNTGLLNRTVPTTRITLLNGDYVSFDQYRGKYTVLIFWAQWCPHSKPVIERLDKLARELRRNDVNYLAISIDENDDYQKLLERIEVSKLSNLQHAFSGNGVMDETYEAFHISALPTIMVIDPSGVVVSEGHDTSAVRSVLN